MNEKRILLVDDDKDFTKATSILLSSRNFIVDIAKTGEEALHKCQHHPDLMLLDRALPDMEGLEICRKIRGNRRLNNIPILVLSGKGAMNDKIEGLYIGADDYITKPFNDEELFARIDAALRRSEFAEEIKKHKSDLMEEVRRILRLKLITPVFQPIVSLGTLRPFGFEVLSRPPKDSALNNPEFLFKVALAFGLYYDLEMLCWEKAFKMWADSGLDNKLFLNCNPYIIECDKFDIDMFQLHGVASKNVILEMTERMSIQDYALFYEKTQRFKEKGLKIAIDDVGSGFASLEAIAETKPEFVKIDISLVSGVNKDILKQNIIKAVVSFCSNSGITTIAEGIEKKKELVKLKELGVDLGQGFFLSRPSEDIIKASRIDVTL